MGIGKQFGTNEAICMGQMCCPVYKYNTPAKCLSVLLFFFSKRRSYMLRRCTVTIKFTVKGRDFMMLSSDCKALCHVLMNAGHISLFSLGKKTVNQSF